MSQRRSSPENAFRAVPLRGDMGAEIWHIKEKLEAENVRYPNFWNISHQYIVLSGISKKRVFEN